MEAGDGDVKWRRGMETSDGDKGWRRRVVSRLPSRLPSRLLVVPTSPLLPLVLLPPNLSLQLTVQFTSHVSRAQPNRPRAGRRGRARPELVKTLLTN